MQIKLSNIIINYNNINEEVYLDKLLQILDNKYLELKEFFGGLVLKENVIFNI